MDTIIGAYNASKKANFMLGTENGILSYLNRTKQRSILVKNNLLLLATSSNSIGSLSRDHVLVAYLGRISGYLVAIPADYRGHALEALWYLYRQYGEGFARFVNGHFVIVLWNENSRCLLLIQDKFPGIMTLYWTLRDGIVYFSNYIKPLLTISREDAYNINKKALYQYLKYSYISAPETIFDGINQVCGGEIVHASDNGVRRYTYDPWQFASRRKTNKEEAIKEYHCLLKDSIKGFVDSNQLTGFLLSGGLDTSVNVAIEAGLAGGPAITIGVGAESRYNTDAEYALRVSQLFQTNHHEYLFDGSEINDLPQIIWQMENPYYEPGLMLSYAALRFAKNYASNIVGGDAADQVFGSCARSAYSRFSLRRNSLGLVMLFRRMVNLLCRNPITEGSSFFRRIENKLVGKCNVNNWCGVFGFRDCDIKEIIREKFCFEEKFDNFQVPDGDLSSLLDFGCTTLDRDYALNGLLSKTGRIADVFGIEYFSPYLDKNVFNFILSLDHTLRSFPCDKGRTGFVAKYLHRQLAMQLLPPEIIERPKQGGAISPYIHLEKVERAQAIKRTIMRSVFLNNLFRGPVMETLFNNVRANAVRILQLLTLDLWHYLFVNGGPEASMPTFSLDDYQT